MWIRSQDRTKLVDASELNICSSYKVVGIYAGINALGMYSTEEKATEETATLTYNGKDYVVNKAVFEKWLAENGKLA